MFTSGWLLGVMILLIIALIGHVASLLLRLSLVVSKKIWDMVAEHLLGIAFDFFASKFTVYQIQARLMIYISFFRKGSCVGNSIDISTKPTPVCSPSTLPSSELTLIS